jgi:competence protein ComFC
MPPQPSPLDSFPVPHYSSLTRFLPTTLELARQAWDALFSLFFPSACPLCAVELTLSSSCGICGACWASLKPWNGPACRHCGLPFASARPGESEEALCAPCRRQEFEFDLARSYGLYAGSLRDLILMLKYHRRERLGPRLGQLLAFVHPTEASDPEPLPLRIVPVPLHPARQHERGYNQSELLARGFLRSLHRAHRGAERPRLETGCLTRVRPTVPQSGLDPQARRENVRGVFAVRNPEKVRGCRVILVDDVMTTGATVSACAAALKRAGAQQVFALTLARATPQFPS